MKSQQSWIEQKYRWESGGYFSSDIDAHIRYFKMIARINGHEAGDDVTKAAFTKSIGINPAIVVDDEGRYKSFQTLEKIARSSADFFSKRVREAETGSDTNSIFKISLNGCQASESSAPVVSMKHNRRGGSRKGQGEKPTATIRGRRD